MIEMDCPHCGHRLRIAEEHRGKLGTCRACGREIQAPAEQGAATAEPSFPENLQDVGIVDMGVYGKAADKAWVDPADQAAKTQETARQEAPVKLPDVPEEILKKHQARRAKRNKITGLAILAIVFVLVLAVIACVLVFVLGGEKPPATMPVEIPDNASPTSVEAGG